MSTRPVAIIVGVGPGLGWALCSAFARGGYHVVGAARRAELAAAEPALGVIAAAGDAPDPASVAALFEHASRDAPPAVVVYNASAFVRGDVLELDPAELESAWRISVLGALHVAQAVLSDNYTSPWTTVTSPHFRER
jgi:NAD(P)-dependent dehydrogenase (short-subunit alcohol dehydrogenase family)